MEYEKILPFYLASSGAREAREAERIQREVLGAQRRVSYSARR